MAVVFQLHILDPDSLPPGGEPMVVGMNFRGMTNEQGEAAVIVLRRTADRIEEHMKKYGTGEILPEADDSPSEFTDEEREELAKENEDASGE